MASGTFSNVIVRILNDGRLQREAVMEKIEVECVLMIGRINHLMVHTADLFASFTLHVRNKTNEGFVVFSIRFFVRISQP